MAKVCSNCGAPIQDGVKFCGKCGQKVPVETFESKVCPNCGAPIQDGVKFCGKCGAAQTVVPQSPQQTATPPQNYNPPRQNYNAQPNYNPPQQNYNAQPNYNPPQQNYNAQPNYNPPRQNYNAQPNYNPPQQNYNAQPNYNPSQQNYNAQPNYNPPQTPPPPQSRDSQSLQKMFLSTNGRINRMKYFLATLAIGLLTVILTVLIYVIFSDDFGNVSPTVIGATGILRIVMLIPQFCLNVQRIKDIGRFPINSLPFTETNIKIVAGIATVACLTFSFTTSIQDTTFGLIIFLFALTLTSGLGFWMQFRRGVVGANEFGEDPLR